jgi:hypothetical protein
MIKKSYSSRAGTIFKRTPANVIEGKPSPFDANSEISLFEKQMKDFAHFNPISHENCHNSSWVDFIVNMPNIEKGRSVIKFLNEPAFNSIDSYFQKKHYSFTNEKTNISLCCHDAGKKMRIIKASFDFVDTPHYANVVFVHSRIPVKILEINAYFKNFGIEEETLQRKIVEANIAFDHQYNSHSTSGFRIFPDKAAAIQTIDDEMFDYLKAIISNNKSCDSGFIIGHESKYRWPLNLNVSELQKGTKNQGLIAVGAYVPQILTVQSDGTTIVYSGDRPKDVLPLADYFNPNKGILGDLGLASKGHLNSYNRYYAACEHCEQKAIPNFRPILMKYLNLKMCNNGFALQGHIAKEIGYEIKLDNLVIKVNDEKVILKEK